MAAEEQADLELAALQDEARADAERSYSAWMAALFAILAYRATRVLHVRDGAEIRAILADHGERLYATFDALVTRTRQAAHDQALRDVAATWLAISGERLQVAPAVQSGADIAADIRDQVIGAMNSYVNAATVQQARWIDLAAQLAADEASVASARRGRVANAVDSDVSLTYGGTSQAAMESLADRGLLKQDVEIIDAKNHPISRVLDGQIVPIGEPFRAPVGLVRSAAAAMRKPAGGIVWPEVDGAYQGMTLPAHFGERGRVRLITQAWR